MIALEEEYSLAPKTYIEGTGIYELGRKSRDFTLGPTGYWVGW